MKQRWWMIGAAVTALFPLALGAFHALEIVRRQALVDAVVRDLKAGRLAMARGPLARLAARWPDEPDVLYARGAYAEAIGRPAAALPLLSRVPPGTRWARESGLLKARILSREHGRFSQAEPILAEIARGKGAVSIEARQRLAELWQWQVRPLDIRRLLREGFEQMPDRAATLRDLWLIENESVPVAGIRSVLDHAEANSPDDDRVWLGRANLALEAGQFSEARRRLDACETRRPSDPAVWIARLRLARSLDRPGEAWPALAHLPADLFDPTEILDLRAWLAASVDDRAAERTALEHWIEVAPGDQHALGRLAELCALAGEARRAEQLRRRKAEADRSRLRYRELLQRPDPAASAQELAELAEFLGRRFESHGWRELAVHRGERSSSRRDGPDRRPAPDGAVVHEPGATLAHLLADLDRGRGRLDSPGPTEKAVVAADFRDDAEQAGLRFVYDNGRSAKRQLPETSGGGVGLFDFDGDGWLDVYLVQGGPFPPPDSGASHDGDRLYRNRGDGCFDDVSIASGIAGMARGYGHGVAVGDYDNDGRPDLFVTRWRSYALYRNRGDGHFEDVTRSAGLGGDRDWPTSAVFADLDNDGDLDLYVCHYLVWDADNPRICAPMAGTTTPSYCHPREFLASPDHLFRNDAGRFVDVTAEAGIVDKDGPGLGVVAADLDGDRLLDLVVANDTTANYFFHNRGRLRFEEIGLAAGLACNARGGFQAGMGVACGDLDRDGRPDIAVTNFYGESTTFFHNLGGGQFIDGTEAVGLAAPSRFLLGFGVAFLDFNNDGRMDLTSANGHVNDYRPHIPYTMPAQLLAGDEKGYLTDVSAGAGPPWQVPRVGRGLAVGDLDNDGRIDTLLVSQNSPLAYFHNETRGGHFVVLQLEGAASNRDSVGAVVTLTGGDRRQVSQRIGGGSYLSASDPRLHFGLGGAARIAMIEVTWPSGIGRQYRDLPADTGYLLREGDAVARPLRGFTPLPVDRHPPEAADR